MFEKKEVLLDVPYTFPITIVRMKIMFKFTIIQNRQGKYVKNISTKAKFIIYMCTVLHYVA